MLYLFKPLAPPPPASPTGVCRSLRHATACQYAIFTHCWRFDFLTRSLGLCGHHISVYSQSNPCNLAMSNLMYSHVYNLMYQYMLIYLVICGYQELVIARRSLSFYFYGLVYCYCNSISAGTRATFFRFV